MEEKLSYERLERDRNTAITTLRHIQSRYASNQKLEDMGKLQRWFRSFRFWLVNCIKPRQGYDDSISRLCEKTLKKMEVDITVLDHHSQIKKVWFNPATKTINIEFNEPVDELRFDRNGAIRLSQRLLGQANKLGRQVRT